VQGVQGSYVCARAPHSAPRRARCAGTAAHQSEFSRV